MYHFKEIKQLTTYIFNSSIGVITKILFSLPLVPQLYISCTYFLDSLIRLLLSDTQSLLLSVLSTVINSTLQPISSEIDSCCYGSGYVNIRNSCQLTISPFQPPPCEFVLVISLSPLRSNCRRAIRVGLSTVLSSDSC